MAPNCRIVIEAGDLKTTAPLRAICERARNAVALPCYPDSEQSLNGLIDQEISRCGTTIAPPARALLVSLLGADRLSSRQELAKLALFARGKESIEIEDVTAVVADASALATDALIDAAFAGGTRALETHLAKARSAALSPGTIMFAALRHAADLHKASLAVAAGASPYEAATPIVRGNFIRRGAVEAALKSWSAPRLERVLRQLGEAAFDARRRSALAETIVQRALLAIAVNARRKE